MIRLKRETDKTISVYRHLFNESFYEAYTAFVRTIFQTFNGPGLDARIRSQIEGEHGNRKLVFGDKWNVDWDSMFDLTNVAPPHEVDETYAKLMDEFRSCIGLEESTLK
jgi:hypothetical protein